MFQGDLTTNIQHNCILVLALGEYNEFHQSDIEKSLGIFVSVQYAICRHKLSFVYCCVYYSVLPEDYEPTNAPFWLSRSQLKSLFVGTSDKALAYFPLLFVSFLLFAYAQFKPQLFSCNTPLKHCFLPRPGCSVAFLVCFKITQLFADMIDSIVPFLIAHPILFIGLSYTQPSSPARFALQGIIFICCFISRFSTFSLSIPGQAGGQYIYGMMMQSSHFMLLAKATPSAYGKPGNELKWSMDMLFSARWGVSPKMLPAFRRKDKSYVPTRWRFLATRSWDLVWTVAMVYIINHYTLNIWQDDFTGVPDGFLRRLSSVTPRELAIRMYVAVVGKFEPYLALRAGHSLVSIIGVGVLSDDPKRYPPLFGSIKEAYRVRRFYV